VLLIGLTGGVATGKSTVVRRLKELGAAVIDADQLAREVVEPGEPALEEIRQRFGPEVIGEDGQLDRARLARIVFEDEEARKALEAIVHPRIRSRMRAKIEEFKAQGEPVVVCDIPLLFETGVALDWVDRTVVVYAPKEVQLQRLMARNGLTLEEAERRIAAQMPTEEKARRADAVIDNSRGLDETFRQVDALWKEWMRDAAGTHRPRQEEG